MRPELTKHRSRQAEPETRHPAALPLSVRKSSKWRSLIADSLVKPVVMSEVASSVLLETFRRLSPCQLPPPRYAQYVWSVAESKMTPSTLRPPWTRPTDTQKPG